MLCWTGVGRHCICHADAAEHPNTAQCTNNAILLHQRLLLLLHRESAELDPHLLLLTAPRRIFGYPTGLGALFVRTEVEPLLKKVWSTHNLVDLFL
jgi:hypothetical protein